MGGGGIQRIVRSLFVVLEIPQTPLPSSHPVVGFPVMTFTLTLNPYYIVAAIGFFVWILCMTYEVLAGYHMSLGQLARAALFYTLFCPLVAALLLCWLVVQYVGPIVLRLRSLIVGDG